MLNWFYEVGWAEALRNPPFGDWWARKTAPTLRNLWFFGLGTFGFLTSGFGITIPRRQSQPRRLSIDCIRHQQSRKPAKEKPKPKEICDGRRRLEVPKKPKEWPSEKEQQERQDSCVYAEWLKNRRRLINAHSPEQSKRWRRYIGTLEASLQQVGVVPKIHNFLLRRHGI